MSRPLLASELFAISQNAVCDGPLECHWCGGPCDFAKQHNDPMPHIIGPGCYNMNRAYRPGCSYMCLGCWSWYYPSTTVQLLYTHGNGTVKQVDGQSPCKHSWWITEEGSWAITPICYENLYDILLKPPPTFCLTLLDDVKIHHRIHLSVVNDLMVVKKDTPLLFTINNVKYQYTLMELEACLRYGPSGREPGAQALVRQLGSYELDEEKRLRKKGPGRPPPLPDGKTTKERVFNSGVKVTN